MQINISCRHGHLSEETQQLMREKVERIRKFYDRLTSIVVTADMEHREKPKVELIVTAEHHSEFVATDIAETVLTALDSTIHKVEMQLKKHKEKLTEHRVTSPKHIEIPSKDAE